MYEQYKKNYLMPEEPVPCFGILFSAYCHVVKIGMLMTFSGIVLCEIYEVEIDKNKYM